MPGRPGRAAPRSPAARSRSRSNRRPRAPSRSRVQCPRSLATPHQWHHPAIRKGLLIGSAAAAAAWWTPALAPIVPAVADALGLARRIEDPAGAALTFDDGPHPEGTPAVLETLAAAGAPA